MAIHSVEMPDQKSGYGYYSYGYYSANNRNTKIKGPNDKIAPTPDQGKCPHATDATIFV